MFAFAVRRGKHLQLLLRDRGLKSQNQTLLPPNSPSLFGPRCYAAARKLKPSKSTSIKANPTRKKRVVPSNNAQATSVAPTGGKASKADQTMPLEAKPVKFPSHVLSTTTISITVNNVALKLPLPDQSFGGMESNSGMWPIYRPPAPVKFIPAEFLNRQTLLLQLLSATFDNLLMAKPRYALQAMGRGSGKTRLLVEWIYQALNDESVVHSFLNGNTNVIPNAKITEDDKTKPDKKQRRQFINSLVDTVYNQRIILYKGIILPSLASGKDAFADLTELIKHNIVERFLKTKALYKKKQIAVTSKWLDSFEKDGAGKQLPTFELCSEYLDLLNTLITTELPGSYMPFPNDGLHEKKMVIFGIDECQVYSRETKPGEDDRVYQLFRAAAAIHFTALGANTNLFCMAVGTYLPGYDSKEEQSNWSPVVGSMDSLLDIKYLDQITKSLFKKVLPRQVSLGNEGRHPTLHKKTARILLQTFIRTFGIPRAIAFMVGEIYYTIPKAEELLQAKDLYASQCDANAELPCNVDTFAAEAVKELSNIEPAVAAKLAYAYPDLGKWPEQVPKPASKQLELLDIKAALCLAQHSHVKSKGFAYSLADLEECDYLIQWHKISETTKRYTRPFLILDDTIARPLTAVKNKVPSNDDWIRLEMTIASLILHPDLAKQLSFDNFLKGSIFEKATAISLYVRFAVQQLEKDTEMMELKSILEMDTAGLNIGTIQNARAAWQGVVKLTKQIKANSTELLEKIHKNQVVAVDVSNSEFADVIVPLTTADGAQIFLGLQAKQYQDTPSAEVIAKNAMATLANPNFYYAVISPNKVSLDEIKNHITTLGKAAKLTSKEIESRQARLCDIPANAIVSPLYLAFYGFAPVIDALTEPTNN